MCITLQNGALIAACAYSEINGHCVAGYGKNWRDQKTYSDADKDCKERGGHLLYIQDMDKYNDLKSKHHTVLTLLLYHKILNCP